MLLQKKLIEFASTTPNKFAIVSQDATITYGELLHLVQNYAAQISQLPSQVIAISAERTAENVALLLAIQWCGKAYLPIANDAPLERVQKIIQAAKVQSFVFTTPLNGSAPWAGLFQEQIQIQSIHSQYFPATEVPEQIPAYVLFTSGSTGEPKGVVLPRQALDNLVDFQYDFDHHQPFSCVLLAPLTFDVSYQEVASTLVAGGTLHCVPNEVRLNPFELLSYVEQQKIQRLYLPNVSLHYLVNAAMQAQIFPKSLLQIITAGEQLKISPNIQTFFNKLPGTQLINDYGPTETHVVTRFVLTGAPNSWPLLPAIGTPIAGAEAHIKTADGTWLEGDGNGELYLSGTCLANGYIGNSVLTNEKFAPINTQLGLVRAYKTGDLVRRENNVLHFISRADDQVKVRGNRVELADIEANIGAIPGVQQVAVKLETVQELQWLVAFVQSETWNDANQIRQALAAKVPDYMVPDAVEFVKTFPKTSSGKIDKLKLIFTKPILLTNNAVFANTTQNKLAALWQHILQTAVTHTQQHFFHSGGNSLKAIQLIAAVQKEFGIILPITAIFQDATLEGMSILIDKPISKALENIPASTHAIAPSQKVAVIGMNGKFPGAKNVQEFWNMLVNEQEGIELFSEEAKEPLAPTEEGDYFVAAKGNIHGSDCFDEQFFDMSPSLAQVMDPQQRQFVQVSYQLLHATQHLPNQYKQPIGVFAGTGNNTYYNHHVLTNSTALEAVGDFQAMLHNEKDYVATRTAYLLNLTGPAVSVYAACSTSLLAIAQAVQSIRAGQCTVAIAGAASIQTAAQDGYTHTPGGVYSADGHTRSFSTNATGTVFTNGVAAVLLKNYDQALADGDTIYAVVTGVGINNDGAVKASFMAPSSAGQAQAITNAMADAAVEPSQITLIEGHGTATPIGDPIEIEALQWAFANAPENHSVALGSVKSNIGHLTAASGVAAFIKTVLSIYHKTIPASINCENETGSLHQASNCFYVPKHTQAWNSKMPRMAGISNFGVGGTNVHVIIAEAEEAEAPNSSDFKEGAQVLLPISAHSETALEKYVQHLASYSYKPQQLPAVRSAFFETKQHTVRTYLYGKTWEEILASATLKTIHTAAGGVLPVVFLVPGQGSQYVGMGSACYQQNEVFKNAVDTCANLLLPTLGFDIRQAMFENNAAMYSINDTVVAQPAIFVSSYANYKLVAAAGIHPQAIIGHSVGELLAATIAGVLSLADALHIVAHRAMAMQQTEEGAMVGVPVSSLDIQPYLKEGVYVAGINSDKQTVVAGSLPSMQNFTQALAQKGIQPKQLATKHAFHTPAMEPILPSFLQSIEHIQAKAPTISWVSTKTGELINEAIPASYWAKQIANPVLFKQAMDTVCALYPTAVFIDLGAQPVASSLALQNTDNEVVQLCKGKQQFSEATVQEGLAKLWQLGFPVQWKTVCTHTTLGQKIHLPQYVFNERKHWLPYQNRQATPNESFATPALVENQPTQTFSFAQQIANTVAKVAGSPIDQKHFDTPFGFLGMDSLVLTQLAIVLKNQFKKPLKFRELSEQLNTIHALEKYFNQDGVANSQLANTTVAKLTVTLSEADKAALAKPFGATARIEKKVTEVSETQLQWLQQLITNYVAKSAKSKAYAQQHRKHMADPRVVTGFKPLTKEMVYPLVMQQSIGCTITDIDGNSYIDVLNGFGSNFMGYQHPVLKKALLQQVENGYELGPQHILAGEVCELITKVTGHQRAALCNTGSEAVLGAMRMARTYTGKNIIVAFSGSYHGINDEVIVRATFGGKAYPAASGILPEVVSNMLILDYGTDEALQKIKEYANEIAAVLVEPVQSRRPDFFPIEFLKSLRTLTQEENIVLVFDEVISGFRFHNAGIQGMLGIQADIGTYGKVLGGGLPLGMIAGSTELMDTLDGGFWEYGNDSVPEVGVTYFAGTFVRHPLVLATAKATLHFLMEQGAAQIKALNAKTKYLAQQMNFIAQKYKAPYTIVYFGSLWRIRIEDEVPYADLICAFMRWKGIHISDSFPCFLTLAHTEQDVEAVIRAFTEGVSQMQQMGFFDTYAAQTAQKPRLFAQQPPVPGARLGRDADDNPGWYITHANGDFERVNEFSLNN